MLGSYQLVINVRNMLEASIYTSIYAFVPSNQIWSLKHYFAIFLNVFLS